MSLISLSSKGVLKILQARLQQYENWEIPDVQAGFRKGRGTIEQISNIYWIIEKAREFQTKHLLLLSWLDQSLRVCGSQQTGTYSKRWEYQTTLHASWEICMWVKKQQLELDMEQQASSKLGKEHDKAVYGQPSHLNYMQITLRETPGWMKRTEESRFREDTPITSDMQLSPP